MKKIDQHIFGGMQRDLSISKQKPEFLWDAHNIRLTAREGDTMLSITNEKGTSEIKNVSFTGNFLGYCVLDNYLVVFTADTQNNTDYIYRIDKNNNYKQDTLFSGNLSFKLDHPIETLGVYENEFIQKVYWVDGSNQPRVINITKNALLGKTVEEVRKSYNPNSFDFVQKLKLEEVVNVTKESSSSGMFPAGTIQYAISYYNKYGQESNIAYVTPLFYTSYPNRAGSPEDRLGNAFKIKVNNVDSNFNYLRIYSIFRTSKDAIPTVKRVVDLEIKYSDELTIRNQETGRYFTALARDAIEMNTGNGSWINITHPDCPVKPMSFTINNSVFSDTDTYQVFKKSEYPYLILKDKYTGYYYTWGDANEIIISTNEKAGPSGNAYYIIGNDNPLVRASYADYGMATNGLSYVDNGQSGDTIDPTQLLYIGGEDITAGTITAKDNTLFLGNISINRRSPSSIIGKTDYKDKIGRSTRSISLISDITSGNYNYYSTLNAKAANGYDTNASGFKSQEKYRLGVQFQYKNGKWSEPVFLDDVTQDKQPSMKGNTLNIPEFTLDADFSKLTELEYKRVRPIVVFPTLQERRVIAQGLLAPTVYSLQGRENSTPYAQSSWFFRLNGQSGIQNKHDYTLYGGLIGKSSKYSEIQGVPKELSGIDVSSTSDIVKSGKATVYIGPNKDQHIDVKKEQMDSVFAVDQNIVTMHSPDLEFDDTMQSINYGDFKLRLIGKAHFNYDMGDIDIETSSPTISHEATGFMHNTYNGAATSQLCAGLFYDDYLVDDYDKNDPTKFRAYDRQKHSFLFMVYPWNKSGSLNNDIVRPNNGGSRSAVLKRKKISNLKFSQTTDYGNYDYVKSFPTTYDINAQIFDSDQVQLVKVNGHSYYGNIDTMLAPVVPYGSIFATGETETATLTGDKIPTFNSTDLYIQTKHATCVSSVPNSDNPSGYKSVSTELGDYTGSLRVTKEAIRMKYKSSPHFVFQLNNNNTTTLPNGSTDNNTADTLPWLWIGEIYRETNEDLMFGGTTDDALKANLWFPCGESVEINDKNTNNGVTNIEWKYGDTWYERYDCLKTYPFTMEDENSIIEIASFMCETRVNIDGRYDKNRGQDSNLFMTPQNFNLLNNVYSQYDSFFNYRLLDSDYYALNNFPASIIWSLQKQSASIVDNWTTVTMANILDLDGSKGSVNALKVWNDNIYCFQDTGISNILFNSRVQIPISDNVPIEISNNYKVDGERYISNSLGCKNKWSICVTESGIYFIDSISNSLYNLGNSMTNISNTHGFSNWFDEQLLQVDEKTFYDKNMNDLYITTKNTALCFSELLGQFTSFMSYKNPDAMFNIGSDFYTIRDNKLWKMFAGNYNSFFNNYEPFDITFISNNDSAEDKIFTNIELRADFYANDTLLHNSSFNYVRAWNEYQDTGKVKLDYTRCKPSNLKKKFRIWRIDIPRDKTHKLDRIRNTWTKIQLGTYSSDEFTKLKIKKDVSDVIKKSNMELHDLSVEYFI